MSISPKVRTLSLYRSGVGYVSRIGDVTGSFTLPIRTEHVNDVLSSLTTRGPILGVSFDSRKDPKEELRRRNMEFSPKGTFRDFVGNKCRGRSVRVVYDPSVQTARATVLATVMGLDSVTVATQDGKGTVTQDRVVLRDSTGSIFQVALDSILSLTPTDDSTNEDLDFYTLTSREEARVRDLRVRVSDGDSSRKVELGYLVPAARWGVKYDLTYSEGSDTATLTPWAIAHNPLDEALEGVTLRLATGSPTSFQTNLHEPKVPVRATLQEDMNVQAPTVYRSEAAPVAVAAAFSTRSISSNSMRSAAFESTISGASSIDDDSVGESDTQADVEDTGEETEFVLTDVNLPPTSAVTLPLTRRDLSAEIRRVWRQETGPNPDMAVKLVNSRDMVLEKGAVTIRIGDKFVGQAVLPHTPKAGGDDTGLCQRQVPASVPFLGGCGFPDNQSVLCEGLFWLSTSGGCQGDSAHR